MKIQAVIVNYHQVKNIEPQGIYDLVIIDESHRWIAGYPKRSTIWTEVKKVTRGAPVIFSSGTLTPEGYSGLYNMLALSDNTPWGKYLRFTHWFYGYSVWQHKATKKLRHYDINYDPTGKNIEALKFIKQVRKGYGKPYQKKIADEWRDQHDKTKERMVIKDVKKITVTITRKEGGHKHEATDKLIQIPLSKRQSRFVKQLEEDLVIDRYDILGDTPSKLIQKLHQISGGFVKTENDLYTFKKNPKIAWLRENIDPERTIILANYIAEQKALAEIFPHTGSITKNAEGVDYSGFPLMVIYSMGFSAATYQQVRARQMNINRDTPVEILYLISGIDSYVYKAVQAKKSFTAIWYRNNK